MRRPSDVPSDMDVQRAWAQLRRGQRQGCAVLFRTFYEDLYNYGLRLCHREQYVKDAIQDVFLTLWRTRDRLADVSSVKAYLLSSLRRTLLRTLDRDRRRDDRNERYSAERATISFSPEEVLIRFEHTLAQKKAVVQALNALSGRQKEAIFLRYFNGLTNDEIAAVLDVTNQSVRNYLYRARTTLREQGQRLTPEALAGLMLLLPAWGLP
ncbi:MAG: sigma-70 family RNA polymerase sigma factor [Bacteroidetes bacterium]|jgi:RNA polymerase sigma-70 factor (ECF subfamily)|nr:sigma-70 family RNA polymerase sigma factor [Bacteroidota bacterium]